MQAIRNWGSHLFTNNTINNASESPLEVCCINVIPGENWMCPICQDGDNSANCTKILNCGHTFHTECLKPWVERPDASCPVCRGPIYVSDSTSRIRNEHALSDIDTTDSSDDASPDIGYNSAEDDEFPFQHSAASYDIIRRGIMASWNDNMNWYHENGIGQSEQYLEDEYRTVRALESLHERSHMQGQPYNAREDARRTVGYIDEDGILHVSRYDSNAAAVPFQQVVEPYHEIPNSMSEDTMQSVRHVEDLLTEVETTLNRLYNNREILSLNDFPLTRQYIGLSGNMHANQQVHRVLNVTAEPAPQLLQAEVQSIGGGLSTSRPTRSARSRTRSGRAFTPLGHNPRRNDRL